MFNAHPKLVLKSREVRTNSSMIPYLLGQIVNPYMFLGCHKEVRPEIYEILEIM
jgi:hypothetical protein